MRVPSRAREHFRLAKKASSLKLNGIMVRLGVLEMAIIRSNQRQNSCVSVPGDNHRFSPAYRRKPIAALMFLILQFRFSACWQQHYGGLAESGQCSRLILGNPRKRIEGSNPSPYLRPVPVSAVERALSIPVSCRQFDALVCPNRIHAPTDHVFCHHPLI